MPCDTGFGLVDALCSGCWKLGYRVQNDWMRLYENGGLAKGCYISSGSQYHVFMGHYALDRIRWRWLSGTSYILLGGFMTSCLVQGEKDIWYKHVNIQKVAEHCSRIINICSHAPK